MFLDTERLINHKVAHDLLLSSIIVVDDLLRDHRVKNKGINIPSSLTGINVKVLIPLKREFDVPTQARLAEERAFLVDPANPARRARC